MKKTLYCLLAITLTFNLPALHAQSNYEYITQEAYSSEDVDHQKPIKYKALPHPKGPIGTSSEALATSMFGWGIGLAIGIMVLSAVIPNSTDPNVTHRGIDPTPKTTQ